MTIIANLDAEIEQFYAEQGSVTRELRIFQRDWLLIPAMTSITLAPLMQIQAAAQMANDGGVNVEDAETKAALFQFLGGVNDILANVIHEDERAEFKKVIDERGFPLGILDKVIEAIMQAFDAAPFDSATQTSPAKETVPLHVRLSGSGNSSEGAGDTSTPTSTPTPSATPPHGQPVPLAAVPQPPAQPQTAESGLTVAEWGQEPTLPAYSEDTALIPPSVQDVPPLS